MRVNPSGARWLAVAAVALAPALQLLPTPVRAAAPACPASLTALGFTRTADTTPSDGGSEFIVCSGKVPSFDGTPLDADVTLPAAATGPLPLMVFLHGWGDDKTQFESTTLAGGDGFNWHWNNAWFASQGYAVLTYNARGFDTSCGKFPAAQYSYATDPACAGKSSWTHLSDRRWEIHDTQQLAGVLVDAGVATPNVAVSGDSYGGGQSWLMALSQDRMVVSDGAGGWREVPWTSPAGTALHLRAAVPQYTWTDLAESLVRNGRQSDGLGGAAPPPAAQDSPIGVEKQSYVAGLYALGQAFAQYAPPQVDTTADLSDWFAGINAGEPYEQNPYTQQALSEVGGANRSAYAMPVPDAAHEVPVFNVQGDTDPLFPGIENLQEVNRLHSADPNYPVWSFFGDVGHSNAQNPSDVWHQANTEANTFLQAAMQGQRPALPAVTVTTTRCVAGQTLETYSAGSYGGIAISAESFADSSTQSTVSSQGVQPEGKDADPIVNSGCLHSTAQDQGDAVYTFTPAASDTLTGSPLVTAQVTTTGANAELAARLWDVGSDGTTLTLVSRSVFRISGVTPGSATSISFELNPVAWQMVCGHQLRLELTQNDAPSWRPDNEPSSLTLSNVGLRLPDRPGAACVPSTDLPETPCGVPLLALAALPPVALAAGLRRRRTRRS